ncbi:MAG TPA: lysozyme inhibitor LprI family protein, partial [Patescibacteria group bacterium]|nr:lysozyme inhibitor LprI family protein [Patescibacteria group bacterium]
LLLCLLPCASARAASFDCAKATTTVEQLVCTNPALSDLDDDLAATYRQATSLASPGDAEPKQSQRTWLKRRNACSDADCVAAAYQARIAELEDAIGQDLNAEAIAGTYTRRDNDYSDDGEPSEITVRALPDGRVAIDGEALWIGNADAGNVHTGTLEGDYALRGGRIDYRDGDDEWSCALTLRFARDALDVHEPRPTCGGMNVRFGGRYVKR